MRNKKRLAILLALAMIITMIPLPVFAQETNVFSDMPEGWSKTALQNAVSNGLLKGDDGNIRPNDYLTRAQMAAIINRAFGAAEKSSLKDYQDVSASSWYYDDMAKAVHMGTFIGNGGFLQPDKNITREEAFAAIARAFKISGASSGVINRFSDKESVSTWAAKDAASLVEAGYIAGSDGKLNPKANITRAEFAQMMDNLIKQYIKTDGTYTEIASGNVMINVPGVTLKNVVVKGDLVIGDGVGEGNVTLDNVDITGRMVVRGGGVNSIIVKGDSNIDTIIIAKVDGKVRIYSEDGTEIGTVIADGSDDVIIEGNYGAVIIFADNVTVTALNANIDNVKIDGDNSVLVVKENSLVETVSVNGNDVNIQGEGEVDEVFVYSSNVTIETLYTAVTAAIGSSDVMAAGTEVELGETVVTKMESISTGSSGGSSSVQKVADINIATAPTYVDGLANDETILISFSTSTDGVDIYYTLNGDTPTVSSILYTVPFEVKSTNFAGETVTVKAIGIKSGMSNSTVVQKEIVFNEASIENAKLAAISELEGLVAESDYRDGEKLILTNAIEDGITAINIATTTTDVTIALENAIFAIGEIPTDEELTNAEKAADQAAADEVKDMITALPAVAGMTLADKSDVEAARAAYDELTADQKVLVTNLSTLTVAETKIAELEADAAAIAEADSFKTTYASVLALTTDSVTISDETDVDTALAAYGSLSEAAKSKLTAEKTLLDNLEAKINDLIQEAADQAAADEVKDMITALPAVADMTLTDKSDVEAARAAYDGLTADQKALVTNLSTLTVAETKIAELEADAAAIAEADSFKTTYASVLALTTDSVTISDETDVDTALAAYGSLSEAAKSKLTAEKTLLDNLEAKINDLIQEAADQAAADEVKDMITALPAVAGMTLADKSDVEAARAAYDELTADQKVLVTNLSTLTVAETKIAELEADAAAIAEADSFKTTYASVLALTTDSVTISDETDVDTALAAYGSLSEAAKSKLTAEKTLLDNLEAKINDLIQEAADQAAADEVKDMITALPAVADMTLTDKSDVEAARAAYDGLTADQKALVTNLSTLTAAETKIAELEVIAAADADITNAIELIPTTFTATEGTDTNLIETLNGIDGLAATGVILTIESFNANVGSDGAITYTDDEVIGNALVKINKYPGTEQIKTVSVTIPEAIPAIASGDLLDADNGSDFTGVIYTNGGNIYYNQVDISGRWGNEVLIGIGTIGTLAIDCSDNPHVAYVTTASAIGYVMYDGTDWTDEEYIVSNNGGICSKPDIAVDSNGFAHITYTDTKGNIGDDYDKPDIMYATNSFDGSGEFTKTLIFNGYGYYNFSNKVNYIYYSNGSKITVNENGDYFIGATKYDYQNDGSIYKYYYIDVKSNLGNGNIAIASSDNLFDLTATGEKVVALYNQSAFKTSELTVGGTTINFTNTAELTGTSVSTVKTDGTNVVVGGISSSYLQTHYNSVSTIYNASGSEIVVKGTKVSIVNINGTFYAFYTDNSDGNIKMIEIE